MVKKLKSLLKVGTVIPVQVSRSHIDNSIPCDKDHCMLALAKLDYLMVKYGTERSFRLKCTNHGLQFDINGRRITVVFDTKTGNTIYEYDSIYTHTHSKKKARESV